MHRWATCWIASIFMLAAFTSPSWSQPGCPTNSVGCWGGGSITSDLPQGSCNTGMATASYDAALGTVNANFCCWFGGSSVRVEDDFIVSNVPPNTPLALRATLQISLCCSSQSSGGSNGHAKISGPGGTTRTASASAYHGTSECQTAPLDLPIQASAGQPFRISYEVSTSVTEGGGSGSRGQLVFQDLPPGASIRSCHGFGQDFPVPARAVSWGGVKLLYR